MVWNAHTAEIYLNLLIPSVLHYNRESIQRKERKKKFSPTGRRDNRCKKGTDETEKTQKTQGGFFDAKGTSSGVIKGTYLSEIVCDVCCSWRVWLDEFCIWVWNVLCFCYRHKQNILVLAEAGIGQWGLFSVFGKFHSIHICKKLNY